MILKQAGLEEVEEDIVELENLMRVNFLVVLRSRVGVWMTFDSL